MHKIWLVCYDIANNKRRYYLSRLLSQYGARVQYSAFEVMMSDDDFIKVRWQIKRLINPCEDTLNYYCICVWCRKNIHCQGTAKLVPFNTYTAIC